MKKLFNIIFIISCIYIISACSKDDNITNNKQDFIEISEDTLTIGPNGGTVETVINSSGEWNISGHSEWIEPVTTGGKSGDKLSFTVSGNDIKEQKEYTYKVFSGSAVKNLVIISLPEIEFSLLSDTKNKVPSNGKVVKVYVQTNVPGLKFEYSDGGEEWIEMVNNQYVLNGKRQISFSVKESLIYKNRKSTVTIKALDKSATVDFEQLQKDIVIQEGEYNFYGLEEKDDVDLLIKSNVEFKTELQYPANQWMRIKETIKGETDDDGLTQYTLKAKINSSSQSRLGKLRFLYNRNIMLESYIRQLSENPELITIPDPILQKRLEENSCILIREDKNGQCELLQEGLEKTYLDISGDEDDMENRIKTLEGLEVFSKITSLNISNNDLKIADLTKFHNITYLTINGNINIQEINIGDNKISSVNVDSPTSSKTLKISGDAVTSISAQVYGDNLKLLDKLEILDLTNCPNISSISVNYREGLKQIVFTPEQMKKYEDGNIYLYKSETTEIVVKE